MERIVDIIKSQVDAMESFAISAQDIIKNNKKADSDKYNNQLKRLLKDTNTQGRKLEWRSTLLRSLPKIKEVNDLKQRISEARAAAQQAGDSLGDWERVNKYIKKLKEKINYEKKELEQASSKKKRIWLEARIKEFDNNLMAEIKRYDLNKKRIGENIAILIQVLKEARTIVYNAPWTDINKIIENKEAVELFLRGEGIYGALDFNSRINMWYYGPEDRRTKIRVLPSGLNLSGKKVDLSEFCFNGLTIEKPSFKYATLKGASFVKSTIIDGNFESAICNKINFTLAFIKSTRFTNAELTEANFSRATIISSTFDGAILCRANLGAAKIDSSSFDNADLEDAYCDGISFMKLETLKRAKNWKKALNVPQKILQEDSVQNRL